MIKRSVLWWGSGAAVSLSVVLLGASCSSSPQLSSLAQGCSINSDCDTPLICAFTRCHAQCTNSRDCAAGETCVTTSGGGVCRLPEETTCTTPAACPTGLVCGTDMTCGNGCATSAECTLAGQQCTAGTCHDTPAEAGAGGDAPTDTSVPVDTGVDAKVAVDSPADVPVDSPADVPVDSPADVPPPVDACGVPGDAGTLGYLPSNFNPDTVAVADGGGVDGAISGAGIDWANAPDVDINANCGVNGSLQYPGCLPAPITVTLSDGSHAWLFALHSLKVESSVTLSLTSPSHNQVEQPPMIFAVLTTVDVQGTIDAGAHGIFPGPGANGDPGGPSPQGPGGGGNGFTAGYPDSAPSGGSFCGVGGRGGFTAPPEAPAGGTYGTATLVPLVAGSGGGWGGGGYFGPGGGALQISAGQSIYVRPIGVITAGGGGGGNSAAASTAGGSGGAILLEAPSVRIDGIVAANGGAGAAGSVGADSVGGDGTPNNIAAPGGTYAGVLGGDGSAGTTINGAAGGQSAADASAPAWGSGGGGAGWIRINSTCGASLGANSIISPDLTTSCASQGALAP